PFKATTPSSASSRTTSSRDGLVTSATTPTSPHRRPRAKSPTSNSQLPQRSEDLPPSLTVHDRTSRRSVRWIEGEAFGKIKGRNYVKFRSKQPWPPPPET